MYVCMSMFVCSFLGHRSCSYNLVIACPSALNIAACRLLRTFSEANTDAKEIIAEGGYPNAIVILLLEEFTVPEQVWAADTLASILESFNWFYPVRN